MAVQTAPRKATAEKAGEKGYTDVDRQALVDALNGDLAGEFQAIIMYIQYSAKLTGPFRNELRNFFQSEIADEQGHAQFLSDKIATLGGDVRKFVPPLVARRMKEKLQQRGAR